jgi:hypothetical protein
MGHPKVGANAGPSTLLRSAQDDRPFVVLALLKPANPGKNWQK